MGNKKYLIGGAVVAAAGYLYYKYSDELGFEYEAEFETEVEVVEPDTDDGHDVEVEDVHDEDQHDEDDHDESHEDDDTQQDAEDGEDNRDYDQLMDDALAAIEANAVEGTNVYAVEPFDKYAEGTPLSKYDELESEPDIVISSFAGRNLMFVVADDERLDDIDGVSGVIDDVSEKAGFSVLLVIPDTDEAREQAEQIKEQLSSDIGLYVKPPEEISEAL